MTEYEVIDAINSLRAETGQHVMNFVSVMFGYIAAAYFVGRKLSRFQASAITLIYIVWAPGPLTGVYDGTAALKEVYEKYGNTVPIEMSASGSLHHAPTIAIASLSLSLLLSIVFMFQTRRTEKKDEPAA